LFWIPLHAQEFAEKNRRREDEKEDSSPPRRVHPDGSSP